MNALGFEVIATEEVALTGAALPTEARLMSPYVWQTLDARPERDDKKREPGFVKHPATANPLKMLVRVVRDGADSTGTIWHATGDGLAFIASEAPVLTPGPDLLDIGGCEDPTLVPVDDGCLIYYTGIGTKGRAQLLWASGPGIRALEKRGVAHASTASDRNTKEAAVERRGEEWLLLFEYSRGGRSRIGRATADSPAGPWREKADPMATRPGAWDNWHLSTGPLLVDAPGGPVMFYNGAYADAEWSIGWVQFDADCTRVVARCVAPLIAAPSRAGPKGRQMAFAASAVVRDDGEIWLYYTHDDRMLRRARLLRTG